MEGSGKKRKSFYVVQFIEENKPFEGIDDCVCVPYTWVVIRVTDKNVVVSYPNNKDSFDTRDRAIKKERYSDKWRFYKAEIKYESDTYKDAELWIATRSDYALSDSRIEDAPQPIPTSSSESHNTSRKHSSKSENDKQQLKVEASNKSQKPHPNKSLKRPAQKESKEHHDDSYLTLNKVARSIISACNYAFMEPGCSKKERPILITKSDQREAIEPSSSRVTGEKHRSPPVRQAKHQQPSMPVIDVDGPTAVIDIKKEEHIEGEWQPSEINSSIQSHLNNNKTSASMATPQLPTAAAQSPYLDQHDHRCRVTGEKHRSPPVCQAKNQQPSTPVIDDDGPTKVIDIKKEAHMEGEMQPSEINSSIQSHLNNNKTSASMATPQLSTAAAQSPYLDQHDHRSRVTGEEHRSPPVCQAKNQQLSTPVIDNDVPTKVIDIKKEAHMEGERQPSEINSSIQSHLNNNKTSASMATPQLPAAAAQSPYLDQHDHRCRVTGEEHRSPPVCQAKNQQPSTPVIDDDGPTKVIDIKKEAHMEGEMQPSEINSSIQSHLNNNKTSASMATPQLPTAAAQSPYLDQHDHRSRVTGEEHRSPPVCQAKNQQLSTPVIDDDVPTKVIDIKKEAHMEGERQPSEINSSIQSHLNNNKTSAAMATPQLPTATAQSPHLDQHDHRKHLQNREKYLNFQPLITDVRFIRENDSNGTTRTDEISNNEPNVSHHLPSSLKTCAQIYSEMKRRPSLGQPKPVEERIRLMNSVRNTTSALQNPSNLMDQTRSPTEIQSPTVTLNQSQDVPCLKKNIGRSHDMTALYPRFVPIAPESQHRPIPPHQRPSFVRRINRPRNSLAQKQCQQQPMDVQDAPQRPSGSHSIAQRANFEAGLMNKASTMQRFSNPSANQLYAGVLNSYQNNPGNSHQEQQRQELLRRSTEENIAAHRSNRPLTISIPAVKLISTNIANQMNPSLEFSQQRQLPPHYQDLQYQPCPSAAKLGAPIKAKNDREMPTLQGVTKRSPPPVQTNIPKSIKQAPSTSQSDGLLELQRLVARMKGESIENHPGLPASSRNVIPAPTSDMGSVETLTCLSHQSLRIPIRSVNNVHQFPLTQQRLIHQPCRTTMNRVYFEDNIVNSSAIRSPLRAMDNVHQTDERMVGEPLFPDQDEASNFKVVADHEAISNHEMSTGGRVETTSDGPTSTDNQTHSRFVLEQQMLDIFSTLFIQMGSTLCYTFEMYKTLRGSIPECADTYNKILEVVESCNALRASPSAASSSSNTAPTISPVTEERQTRVTDRGNSSSGYQYSNDFVNEAPERRCERSWRMVFPPEYDPRDSKWTLKYQKIVPGLVELVPQKGIYVKDKELKYYKKVSNNCKTLALLLLLEVFSKNALSVCLLFTEIPFNGVVGSIVRPPLYQHACAVLISYVLRYGFLHDWDIDPREILDAIDSKMQEIRTNHGAMVEGL